MTGSGMSPVVRNIWEVIAMETLPSVGIGAELGSASFPVNGRGGREGT